MKQTITYKAGLDIGSTTAKIVLLDQDGTLLFSKYKRHHAKICETAISFFKQLSFIQTHCLLDLKLTGSASLDISKKMGLPFVQEVIATHGLIREKYNNVNTVMDIGGEDSKIIFLNKDSLPDIRMNGSCAGGTGSFIDQMATLLNMTPFQLNKLAESHAHIYPVAPRCGVFAKTDVQNMFSRNIAHADIAGSIFYAVAVQCINTLARGTQIKPKMLLCGGVLTFLPELVKMFKQILNFSDTDIIIPEKSEFTAAWGAALFNKHQGIPLTISQIMEKLTDELSVQGSGQDRMAPLFLNAPHFTTWQSQKNEVSLKRTELALYDGQDCYLGIDSGSTTTKIIVVGKSKEILFSWYENNQGNPIGSVVKGLLALRKKIRAEKPDLTILKTAVTGYGEDLIKTAFNIDKGIVETIAHYEAAKQVDPGVSFVLDIGGQDMKAIFIDHGVINRIELNEACSSGCGSFLETLANSLNLGIEEFAMLACQASAPCDLGTRCTVFMNSKIKQSLRENAAIADISAGLAYSIIKNCLFKVLKLHDPSQLGDHIVLQGGTFKNPSIVRALEKMVEKSVKYSNLPEMMGAFGASLIARQGFWKTPLIQSTFISLCDIEKVQEYQTSQVRCQGCENRCRITKYLFKNNQSFFSGNKCEKYFSSKGDQKQGGFHFFSYKNDLLFNRNTTPGHSIGLRIGIPRCLNLYENYPFWHTLFTHCGIDVVLSSPSTIGMNDKGMGTVMSDNICFPAKLVHGHIHDLMEKKVDRIFYPMVVYETDNFKNVANSYNCPIVSSYPDVIESAINPEEKSGIPFDKPVVNFRNDELLKKACRRYLHQFNIKISTIDTGLKLAKAAQKQLTQLLKDKALQLIKNANQNNSLLIVLAGRPYHLDGLINHKIPQMLSELGAGIISEDAIPEKNKPLQDVQVVTQWAYPNRIYNAANWVAAQSDNIQMVQLNSFGCGPDAIVVDEVKQILKTGNKNHTLIKVDEISSPGSVRLRLRSMIASLKLLKENKETSGLIRKPFLKFNHGDSKRTIWAPFFAEDYSAYLPAVFKNAGYQFEILPRPDRESVNLGLQYANNDICYPGTLVIGDIIKALKTKQYNPQKVAIGITQTGGQCRASNYLSLIRKAMINAGFDDIPVISVTASQGLIEQPGFKIDWLKKMRILIVVTFYADAIAKMYYASASREKNKGDSEKVRHHYMNAVGPSIVHSDYRQIFGFLKKAITAFNGVRCFKKELPKMGVVGEIYAKYNYFANQHVVHWLIDQGIEPVLPPIVDYFIQDLVNYKENIKANVRPRKIKDLLGYPIEWLIHYYHHTINKMLADFKYAIPFDKINQIADDASKILTMTNQFGEGWLVAGEIAAFARHGIYNVISLQPFGCIANHIVSKGVETKIRTHYPNMNMYSLDFDAGMSEANIRNRLHFMVDSLTAS